MSDIILGVEAAIMNMRNIIFAFLKLIVYWKLQKKINEPLRQYDDEVLT